MGIRHTIRRYLERYAGENHEDFEILAFSSANDLLKEYPPDADLIFLDIRMDGINGMAAARQIRQTDSQVCINTRSVTKVSHKSLFFLRTFLCFGQRNAGFLAFSYMSGQRNTGSDIISYTPGQRNKGVEHISYMPKQRNKDYLEIS